MLVLSKAGVGPVAVRKVPGGNFEVDGPVPACLEALSFVEVEFVVVEEMEAEVERARAEYQTVKGRGGGVRSRNNAELKKVEDKLRRAKR